MTGLPPSFLTLGSCPGPGAGAPADAQACPRSKLGLPGQVMGARRGLAQPPACTGRGAGRVASLGAPTLAWTVAPTVAPRGVPRVAPPVRAWWLFPLVGPGGQAGRGRRHLFLRDSRRQGVNVLGWCGAWRAMLVQRGAHPLPSGSSGSGSLGSREPPPGLEVLEWPADGSRSIRSALSRRAPPGPDRARPRPTREQQSRAARSPGRADRTPQPAPTSFLFCSGVGCERRIGGCRPADPGRAGVVACGYATGVQ